jgi:type VI protein secretion system component VasK
MKRTGQGEIFTTIIALFIIIGFFTLMFYIYPIYNVWAKGMKGKSKLKEATYSRQILVQEAKAKMEASKLYAEAEVIRAAGVAKANKIIGHSLRDNEAYLKYLWIHNMEQSQKEIVYIPTEANLPILEARKNK